ncbi:hypothetical protein AGOR_G00199040 [Albula goreensis]|uniref:Fibronectin type-III domain-containing protein n=1 Tax=Albula goreensis TaxID=1534307 RepID=A0A8T3CT39_9TELE|nr:hypothetical protein AGOR_G00199040 [Albula goreensis]
MEVTTEKKGVGITAQSSSPRSPTSSPAPPASGDKGVDKCSSTPFGKKRALSGDTEMDEQKKKDEEEGVMREGKRQKVEEEELEAQMELKIRADTRSRLKLEKVVQKLVEEQLRVLQLSVFDRSLQELRERVEKIDCATKHQQTLNTLQAKIARLAKKFGAANQAKDNTRKPQEALSSSAASTTPTLTAGATSTLRPVRTMVETNPQTNQNMTPRPLATTVSLVQPKPLLTSTPPVSAPILFTTSASLDTTSTLSSQNQMGTLLLQTTPANNGATPSNPSTAPQPLSLQPLLIQLPISVTNTQGAAAVTNSPAGVGLMPVSSLGTVTMPSKAKTTTTATTFILQKPSPSSSALSLPSSPSLPQMTLARAVYPGGSAAVGVPSSGVSVTSARTPTQCVSAAGLTSSSSSLPKSSAPAATGGQPAGPAASGTPSATVMASKTDNQATNSAASKPTVQVPLTGKSGSVIDLTEDDDDVQVTGVQKAPVQSGSLSSSASSVTQRTTGASPALLSSNTRHGPATGSTMRSSPQTGLHSVNGPVIVPCRSPQNSPSKIRSANPNPPPHQFPPLPSLPPPPPRLPPEAGNTSVPQQPQLRLARVQSQNGIVLSWCVEEVDRTCAAVDSYHLYAYHQDQAGPSHWKKIGEVKALPLPMACTLTQFVSGSTYYFAVCARDIYSRYGPFCEPQCTDVINLSSSS